MIVNINIQATKARGGKEHAQCYSSVTCLPSEALAPSATIKSLFTARKSVYCVYSTRVEFFEYIQLLGSKLLCRGHKFDTTADNCINQRCNIRDKCYSRLRCEMGLRRGATQRAIPGKTSSTLLRTCSLPTVSLTPVGSQITGNKTRSLTSDWFRHRQILAIRHLPNKNSPRVTVSPNKVPPPLPINFGQLVLLPTSSRRLFLATWTFGNQDWLDSSPVFITHQ